jgi:HSP20 family protein
MRRKRTGAEGRSPDVDLKDIDVRVEIKHLRSPQRVRKKDADKGYHRIERSYGSFVRSFAVPNSFDVEHINA